jgi:multidrug efflux pump subunit AcrA (membrane-fusion protein)
LDLEFRRVEGEIQTAQKRLAAIEAARLENSPDGQDGSRRYHQWTAEEEEVKELLASLQRQYQILEQQRAELTVRSPIDGKVMTWEIQELLESRPVARGEVLMSVADVGGPWTLELEVPDDQIGHVLRAQEGQNARLDVSWMLAAEPGTPYQGRVESVALAAEPGTHAANSDGPKVRVTVRVDDPGLSHVRPGTSVMGKIHCGRRAVGYVWFREAWETIQKWFWI